MRGALMNEPPQSEAGLVAPWKPSPLGLMRFPSPCNSLLFEFVGLFFLLTSLILFSLPPLFFGLEQAFLLARENSSADGPVCLLETSRTTCCENGITGIAVSVDLRDWFVAVVSEIGTTG